MIFISWYVAAICISFILTSVLPISGEDELCHILLFSKQKASSAFSFSICVFSSCLEPSLQCFKTTESHNFIRDFIERLGGRQEMYVFPRFWLFPGCGWKERWPEPLGQTCLRLCDTGHHGFCGRGCFQRGPGLGEVVSRRGARCLLSWLLIALRLGGILRVRHELVMIILHENDLKLLTQVSALT